MSRKITIPYEDIYDLYVTKNMSKRSVADALGCSVDTVARNLLEYGIQSHKPSDWAQHDAIVFSQTQKEMLDGAMLGDGCLTLGKHSTNACLSYTSKSRQHVEFATELFKEYYLSAGVKSVSYTDSRTNRTYFRYSVRTQSNVAFTNEYNRWYSDGVKHIPRDLKLTPLVCLVWYIGDGGIVHSRNSEEIKLSTHCFTKDEQEEILLPQLSEFEATLYVAGKDKNGNTQYCIHIPHRKEKEFLTYIGECPFEDYAYKWDVKEYKNFCIWNDVDMPARAVKMFEAGMSAGSIAKIIGVDRSTIIAYLQKHGINPKDNLFSRKRVICE